jgi:phosphatidylserine/phosphatidylglycerophosphate/cardiolipin synthase-like enzyme
MDNTETPNEDSTMTQIPPKPAVTLPSDVVFFTRGDNIATRLEMLISTANVSIDVAVYEFTYAPLANALLAARTRSVKVRIVLDATEAKARASVYPSLKAGNADTRTCSAYRIMHNKFMIIDGKTVQTGSFNWTEDANTVNAENAIVIYDKPNLAAAYESQFITIWNQSSTT